MKLIDIELKTAGPQIGLELYNEGQYMLSYMSLNDCVTDLIYHFRIKDFEYLFDSFKNFANARKIIPPYKFRGVCSELFEPTDHISRYVFYANTVGEILKKFEEHEKRAINHPDKFIFGVQGCGIHLFNEAENRYELWLGGNHFKNVADIIAKAKKENKLIPDAVLAEYEAPDKIDVFISHKSCDFKYAKTVYDKLTAAGYVVFLSEISLPAIANADYSHELDKALDNANHLIVIATSYENIMSGWVNYEWSSFANEKRSGRKSGNIITLIKDMQLDRLPYLLRQFEVIPFENSDMLIQMLPKN